MKKNITKKAEQKTVLLKKNYISIMELLLVQQVDLQELVVLAELQA
jgi:hypothetical protein